MKMKEKPISKQARKYKDNKIKFADSVRKYEEKNTANIKSYTSMMQKFCVVITKA